MASITTRSGKGSALTNAEVDANFTNLNTELSGKISASEKGVANGVATLDATGVIPSTQLPSYVDDVKEYANLAGFPATGETGKIYIALDTNKTYRWSGSTYIVITASPGSTDAVPEGSVNLYYTNARAAAAAPVQSVAGKTGAVSLTKSDVGLANVDNTADSAKNVLSATKLTTARTINGTSFDGSANISFNADSVAEGLTNRYFTVQRVRDTVLTGLSTLTNAAVVATDSVLGALGKLQKQITDHFGNTSNPHSTTATQVGLGNVENKSSATIRGEITSSDVTNALGYTPGDVSSSGTQTLVNKTVQSGVYSGTIDQTGSVRSGIVAVPALDIDCSQGNYFTKSISANSAFTFSNAPASRAFAFTLELTHTSGTVTWPTSLQWPNAIAPTLTAGKTHLFVFVTDDGGARWRGSALVNYTN